MTRTASIVPSSYAELFEHYYPYVKSLVLQYRVPYDHHEDVAMTLLTKFIENDMLHQFDADRIGGNGKPMRFASFLSGFIVAYVRYYAEKAYKDYDRERPYIDDNSPRSTTTADDDWMGWLDFNGYVHEDDLSRVEYEMLLRDIRKHLSTIPVRRKKNFLLLFDLILDQIHEHGRIHIRELAELFEVSEPLIQSWRKELGRHLSGVQG